MANLEAEPGGLSVSSSIMETLFYFDAVGCIASKRIATSRNMLKEPYVIMIPCLQFRTEAMGYL